VFLSSFWEGQPLVLVLLDALTSGPAADHMLALRDAGGDFEQAGGEVAVVVRGAPEDIATFKSKLNVALPVLSDPSGQAHHAYGGHGGVASFVIDAGGVVRYAHRADNVLGAPSMYELIDAVCGLTGEVVARPEPKAAPLPIALHGAAGDRQPYAAAHEGSPALTASFACSKCGNSGYELVQVATSGGWISRLFNFQYRKFTAVVCTQCNYAELYRTKGGAAANIADILMGG
jgi:predicted nucleic-acid-binding Zn-ribbon protein/peroxiredoxin